MTTIFRSELRKRFIRSLPCTVCQSMRGVQAAHGPGQHGMSQKRSDSDLLPLCFRHHEEQHRIGWPGFVRKHSLNIRALLATLQEKPRLTVREMDLSSSFSVRCYIALYKGEEFLLLPLSDGIKASIRCAVDVCSEYLRELLLESAPLEAA